MSFFFFGGKALLKYEGLVLLRYRRPVITDGKEIRPAVLTHFHRQLFLALLIRQRRDPIINKIGKQLTQLPWLYRNYLQVATSTNMAIPFFSADSILA